MKIYSWNVNGLRAAQKKGFLNWFEGADADIVCVQEAKASEDQLGPELTEIPGYRFHLCSARRKGYSGTAVWIREDCPGLENAAVSCGLADEEWNEEGRVTRVDTDAFTLFNIYFPNGGSGQERLDYKLSFNEALLMELCELLREGRRIIICGDVNIAHQPIDLKNPKSNEKTSGFLPEERRFLTRLLDAGFVDSFRFLHPDLVKYSWWSMRYRARNTNAGWRIDYFFISRNLLPCLREAMVLDEVGRNEGSPDVSDHAPILLELDFSAIPGVASASDPA